MYRCRRFNAHYTGYFGNDISCKANDFVNDKHTSVSIERFQLIDEARGYLLKWVDDKNNSFSIEHFQLKDKARGYRLKWLYQLIKGYNKNVMSES